MADRHELGSPIPHTAVMSALSFGACQGCSAVRHQQLSNYTVKPARLLPVLLPDSMKSGCDQRKTGNFNDILPEIGR